MDFKFVNKHKKGRITLSYVLQDLNQMDQESFIEKVGFIFEHSPWIAKQAWYLGPFSSISDLHETMVNIVNNTEMDKKLNLLKAHPDLAAKVKMTSESVQEQSGAGLDQLSTEERQEFLDLNKTYTGKFGFPFIMAVSGKTKDDIKSAMKKRVVNNTETELKTALQEIYEIATIRLDSLNKSNSEYSSKS